MTSKYLQVYHVAKMSEPPLAPEEGADYLARDTLLQRARKGLSKKLLVLSAPKGYGKTALIESLFLDLSRSPFLSKGDAPSSAVDYNYSILLHLDKFDNDPRRLAAKLRGALSRIVESKFSSEITDSIEENSTLAFIHSFDTCSLEDIEEWLVDSFNNAVLALINQASTLQHASTSSLVIALDNFECLHEQEAIELIRSFLLHTLSSIHILIASSHRLPEGFLMALTEHSKGGYVVLKADDLAFDAEEITLLVTSHISKAAISTDNIDHYVDIVATATEGWPYGVFIMLEAAQNSESFDALAISDEVMHRIDRYFMSGVFNFLTEEEQSFLLELSIFEESEAVLCDVVLGRTRSLENLRLLAEKCTFLIPLDHTKSRFRFNRMFCRWLRMRFDLATPRGRAQDIHARAAAWYEKQRRFDESARHALFAIDAKPILNLASYTIEHPLGSDDLACLIRAITDAPSSKFSSDPYLCLVSAWIYVHEGRPHVVMKRLECLLKAIAQKDFTSEQLIRFELAKECLRAVSRTLGNKHREGIMCCQNLFISLKDCKNEMARGILALNLAESFERVGDLGKAVEYYTEAIEIAREEDSTLVHWHSQYGLARVQYFYGNISLAALTCQKALASITDDHPIRCAFYAQMALIHLQYLDFDSAEKNIQQSLQGLSEDRNIDLFVDVHLARAQFLLLRGQLVEATHAIAKVFALEGRCVIPRNVLNKALFVRARVALARDNTYEAKEVLERLLEQEDPENPVLKMQIQILTAQLLGKTDNEQTALQIYEQVIEEMRGARYKLLFIEARVCQILLLEQTGDHAKAMMILNGALGVGFSEFIGKEFVEGGIVVRNLLLERKASSRVDAALRQYMHRIISAIGSENEVREHLPEMDAAESSLTSLLTSREIEMLRLLKNGMSRSEISEYASISLNTVKTHIANIYSKLDVHSSVDLLRTINELEIFK